MSSPNSVAQIPPSECVPARPGADNGSRSPLGQLLAEGTTAYSRMGSLVNDRVGAMALTLPGAAFWAGVVLERKLLHCALPVVAAQKPALQA